MLVSCRSGLFYQSTRLLYVRIWNLLRPFHRDYAKYLAGIVVRQLLLLVSGYSMVWVLRICARHAGLPEWIFVISLIVFDGGYLALDLALNFLFATRLAYPLFGRLRTEALGKMFRMPLEWHHRQSTGAVLGRVNNGVGKVVQTAEAVSRELCPAVIQTALSLIPLLVFSAWTGPAVALALVFFLWLTLLENRERHGFRRARARNYERDYEVFAECVQAVQPVVQFGQSGRMLRDYGRIQQQIVSQGTAETLVGNRYGLRRSLILSITKRVCQGIWIWQYRRGALDAAMAMYLNMLLEQVLASFWGYAGLLERLYDGMEPARLLIKLLDEKPAIADDASAAPVPVPDKIGIRLLNVGFSYSRRREVIQRFNLTIEEGKVLGVVGRSGSGKTTIQNLLSRMFEIEQGSIVICGKDIRAWPLEQLRSLFAHVSQAGGIFFSGLSLLDIIRFARPQATFREVVQAARYACIHDDIARMPKKYKTKTGQGGVRLSKGQQQRVALAQALLAMADRKVLILDEFTSQLDSETEEKIMRNIRPLLAGKTVIIIAHRLSTIRRIADQIVVIDKGGIVEQGTHETLVERDGWYAEMTRRQAVA